jgi:hypothetical protein
MSNSNKVKISRDPFVVLGTTDGKKFESLLGVGVFDFVS